MTNLYPTSSGDWRRLIVRRIKEASLAYENAADAGAKRQAAYDQLRFSIGATFLILSEEAEQDRLEGLHEHASVLESLRLQGLHELGLALEALDGGFAEPILQPRKVKGHPQSAKAALLSGFAAAACEALKRGRVPASIADCVVANCLNAMGYQKSTLAPLPRARRSAEAQRLTASTIKGWRRKVREARPGDTTREQYRWATEDPRIRMQIAKLAKTRDWTSVGWIPTRSGEAHIYPVTTSFLECLAIFVALRELLPPPRSVGSSDGIPLAPLVTLPRNHRAEPNRYRTVVDLGVSPGL